VSETVVSAVTAQPYQITVNEGSDHKYRVFAFVPGFQDSAVEPKVRSLEQPQVPAKPLAFKTALTLDQPDQPGGPDFHGFCMVQRIASARLKNTGTQVKVTVRGSTKGSLTIDRMYISQPQPLNGNVNPWDSAADLTKLIDIDKGNAPLVLPANSPPKTVGPVNYNLDKTKDLLIAFDINTALDQGNVRLALLPDGEFYYRAATQQAAVRDRYPDPANPTLKFVTVDGSHYLIEKIEVL